MKIILDVYTGDNSGIQNYYDVGIFSSEGTRRYFLHGGIHIFNYRYIFECEDDYEWLGEEISGNLYDIYSFIDTRVEMWNASKVYLDDDVMFEVFCKYDQELTNYRFIDGLIEKYGDSDIEFTLFINENDCYSLYKYIKEKEINVYFICDDNVL